eukprot:scaffold206437_cov26-Tisochrysis_lutea.AAC.1
MIEKENITIQTLPSVSGKQFDTSLWVSKSHCLDITDPDLVSLQVPLANPFQQVATNDDHGLGTLSLVSFVAEPHTEYFISVEGNEGDCGPVQVFAYLGLP